jgi:hypothetical protein
MNQEEKPMALRYVFDTFPFAALVNYLKIPYLGEKLYSYR